jgi:hypothetical protein
MHNPGGPALLAKVPVDQDVSNWIQESNPEAQGLLVPISVAKDEGF